MNSILSLTRYVWHSHMTEKGIIGLVMTALIPAIFTVGEMYFNKEIYLESSTECLRFLRESVIPINIYITLPFLVMSLTLPAISKLYEKGAITYFFTQPAPRWQIILGLYFGSIVCLLPLLALSSLAPSLIIIFQSGVQYDLNELISLSFKQLFVLSVSAMPYAALCSFLAIWSKKPLIWATFLLFIWGSIIGSLPGGAKFLSIHNYIIGLAKSICEIENIAIELWPPSETPPSDITSFFVLTGLTFIFIFLGQLASKKRDIL